MTGKRKALFLFIKTNLFIPLITLLLTLTSFGLLSPQLGFYLDDWPQLFSLVEQGSEGIKQYFLYDGRPFGFWPDLLFYSLWGTNPFLWHFANYLLRWLVGLFFWLTLIKIWPEHQREAGWAAAIFCVFPLFNQQSMGLTFIAHWCCYVLFMVSVFLMVLAVKQPRKRLLFLVLSFLINIPNLFTYENFIGVEFLRPLFLWFSLSDDIVSKKRIRKTLLYWVPFLILAITYVFWRLFVMENLRDDTSPTLLINLISQPVPTIVSFLTIFIKDVLYMILNVWFPTFSVDLIDFSVPSSNLALLITFVVASLLVGLLFWERSRALLKDEPRDNFNLYAVILGLAGIIFGCLPGWIIMRSVSDSGGIWNDRFGLPAMFGSSLMLVGLIGMLIGQNRLKREIILAIMIGFAVGHNFSITNDYRWASTYANRFFSQLSWRAPYIESGTAILADNEMLPKFGVYPTSFAINLLYPTVEASPKLDYWFFTLYKYFPDQVGQLASGIPIHQGHWYSTFDTDSRNSLVIAWHSDTSQCVWVLTENDRFNPYLSSNTVAALGASNLSRIDPVDTTTGFSENLFGRQNKNTWCYYYEKADLARQTGDWLTTVQLFAEAKEKKLKPSNQTEMMPFIEAFAHTGNSNDSVQLTIDAATKDPSLKLFLCDHWARIAGDLKGDVDVQNAAKLISAQFSCAEIMPKE